MVRDRYALSVLACGVTLPLSFLAGDVVGQAPADQQTSRPGITIEIPGQPSRTSRSIEEAVAMAREARHDGIAKPIVITLPSGVIHLAKPVAFTSADSGTASAPLIIRGQPDGSTVISGAVAIARNPSEEIRIDLARMVPGLKPDLTATGNEASDPATRLLLFQGRRALSPSSWPASGYATDWKPIPGAPTRLTTTRGQLPKGDHLVAAGYVSQDWQYQTSAARSDGSTLTLTLTLQRDRSDVAFQKTVRLRLLNVPGPLAAGRYVVVDGIVRMRPLEERTPIEAALAPSLFTFEGAHDIRIEAVALEKTTGTAVTLANADAITFTDCFIGLTGGYAVDAANSRDIHVERCVVAQTGGGGVRLNGGDRTTLQAARNWVRDSRIVDFGQAIRTYAPGVALTGVGNAVSGSFIGGAPHTGIVLAGNDHRVENNELGFLACETNDAGAIYMGRDWTQRGNRVTRNFLHDVGPGTPAAIVSGIYLDDQFSGTELDHNVMLRMPHGIYIGGGRDNHLNSNVFAGIARSAVWIDNRGMNWQRDAAGPNGMLRQSLAASPYLSPLWRARYPTLPNLLNDRPGDPIGNTATDNVVIGAQFLWAIPMTLTIPGQGNRELPIAKEQDAAFSTGSAAQRYRTFGTLAVAGPNPGLRTKLLFGSYAGNATVCPAA